MQENIGLMMSHLMDHHHPMLHDDGGDDGHLHDCGDDGVHANESDHESDHDYGSDYDHDYVYANENDCVLYVYGCVHLCNVLIVNDHILTHVRHIHNRACVSHLKVQYVVS